MSSFWAWFTENWHSNLIATIAVIYSATQFTTAVQAWMAHQPANWRAAIVSLLVAAVGYAAKDSSTHSTQQEVAKATNEAANKKS